MNITQIPSARVPLVEKDGVLISREWFRFFNNLYYLTGSGSSDTTIPSVSTSVTVITDASIEATFMHMGA